MIKIYASLALSLIFSFTALAQQPLSFSLHNLGEPAQRDFEGFDQEELWSLYETYSQQGRDFQGLIRFDAFDFFDFATHTVHPNGSAMYRLKFHSDNAEALTVYFDEFHLPVGCEMYIYNADQSYFEGPIDHSENNDHMKYVTNDIYGEDLVIEVIQPASVVGEPRLLVRGVGYLFRAVEKPELDERGGGSDPCQVDTSCPEGEAWSCQIDAVVRLRITIGNGVFLCSGSMVNTTALDCRQYMLTAMHCVEGISDDDLGFLQVRFGYQKSGCGSGTGPSSRNRTGVIFLADSNDGGGNSGSDFTLYEVEDEISDSWDPYFAGWDASGTGSNWGAGIHHPSGDWKKISTFTNNLTSQWWGAPGSHWGVVWVATESGHGVTEGGSSGSPIFNSNGLIVGTLTGGASACEVNGAGNGTGPNQPDFYGKMSHHFNNNPNSASQKLRVWLDPLNTGTNVLHGGYRPCNSGAACDAVNIDEEAAADAWVNISPNPTTDEFFVRVERAMTNSRITVYDPQGRLIIDRDEVAGVQRFSLTGQPAGMYYVVVQSSQGWSTTQKVVKY